MSEALTSLLDSAASPDAAARQIIDGPGLLDEARAALPALMDVATHKAGSDGVKAVIGRRLATYPQPPRTDGEAAAWWADYIDTLADCSLASLEAGMRAYVAMPDSEFMPKPGKLRELAFTAPSRSYGRYMRAKRAIQMSEEIPQLAVERVDPADVRAMLADFEARSVSTAKPVLPSIAGKLAEGSAITPQMQALQSRQREQRT
jgi:hypothetical protein